MTEPKIPVSVAFALPDRQVVVELEVEAGINAELAGVHVDPVTVITKARTKLNMTGLSFDINPGEIRSAASTGGDYTVDLNFGGHPLGKATDNNPADDFARSEIDSGVTPVETTMPEAKITFYISNAVRPANAGY